MFFAIVTTRAFLLRNANEWDLIVLWSCGQRPSGWDDHVKFGSEDDVEAFEESEPNPDTADLDDTRPIPGNLGEATDAQREAHLAEILRRIRQGGARGARGGSAK